MTALAAVTPDEVIPAPDAAPTVAVLTELVAPVAVVVPLVAAMAAPAAGAASRAVAPADAGGLDEGVLAVVAVMLPSVAVPATPATARQTVVVSVVVLRPAVAPEPGLLPNVGCVVPDPVVAAVPAPPAVRDVARQWVLALEPLAVRKPRFWTVPVPVEDGCVVVLLPPLVVRSAGATGCWADAFWASV